MSLVPGTYSGPTAFLWCLYRRGRQARLPQPSEDSILTAESIDPRGQRPAVE